MIIAHVDTAGMLAPPPPVLQPWVKLVPGSKSWGFRDVVLSAATQGNDHTFYLFLFFLQPGLFPA